MTHGAEHVQGILGSTIDDGPAMQARMATAVKHPKQGAPMALPSMRGREVKNTGGYAGGWVGGQGGVATTTHTHTHTHKYAHTHTTYPRRTPPTHTLCSMSTAGCEEKNNDDNANTWNEPDEVVRIVVPGSNDGLQQNITYNAVRIMLIDR